MNKVSRIINPYSLLIFGVFIEYFPAFYDKAKPALNIGPVSLYIADIGFIFLCLVAFVSFFAGKGRLPASARYGGSGIQIIFGLFIAFSFLKWLFQSEHDISSLRMLVKYTTAYAFLVFFPMLVARKADLKSFHNLLVVFLVYIFFMHIYAFATQGFASHILSGGFLTILSLLYFLAVNRNHVLAFSPIVSFLVKALVIAIFIMVGHRSGFIGILLGLIVLMFFNKHTAIRETVALLLVLAVGGAMAMALSPDMVTKMYQRATTTFDTSQETYQLRYDQYFVITRIALEENPVIGKPLQSEAVERRRVTREIGGTYRTQEEYVIAPHNLLLEWLYYYGTVGLFLGIALVLAGILFIRRFLAENRSDIQNYQIGVAVLCTMMHNMFFALSNSTAMSTFATFFLYLPLSILITLGRNRKNFSKQEPPAPNTPQQCQKGS